jgi:thioredoxin 1
MMTVKNLTSKNFDEFISEGKSVVDFHADWCGPCKIVSPIVEELSRKMKNVKFGKIDVDNETELAQRFQVMSIPTLIFFKDKDQVDRHTGALSLEEFEDKIEAVK